MADGLQDSEVLRAAGPTQFVHCDNTEDGAIPVLKDNLSIEEFERRRKSHWAIMNVSNCTLSDSTLPAEIVKGMAPNRAHSNTRSSRPTRRTIRRAIRLRWRVGLLTSTWTRSIRQRLQCWRRLRDRTNKSQ